METLTPSQAPGLTRRDFLIRGTLAGAGLVIGAPSILKAVEGPAAPSNMINVGFIGCALQAMDAFSKASGI